MEVKGWEDAAAALGVSLRGIIAGGVGAFVSLNFLDPPKDGRPPLTRLERWMTFFGGWGLAVVGAAPLNAFFELKPSLETGIALLIGLLGMSVAAKMIQTIREVDWKTLWQLVRGGGGQK